MKTQMNTPKAKRVSLANVVLLALFVAASFGLQACESSEDNVLSFDGITNSFEEPQFESEQTQIASAEKKSGGCQENHTGVVVVSNGTDESMTIFCDNRFVGSLHPHSEIKFAVRAGIHALYRGNPQWSEVGNLKKLFSFNLEECEVYSCGI